MAASEQKDEIVIMDEITIPTNQNNTNTGESAWKRRLAEILVRPILQVPKQKHFDENEIKTLEEITVPERVSSNNEDALARRFTHAFNKPSSPMPQNEIERNEDMHVQWSIWNYENLPTKIEPHQQKPYFRNASSFDVETVLPSEPRIRHGGSGIPLAEGKDLVILSDQTTQCELCGGPRIGRCGWCKVTYYCSKTCQKLHWKIHKKECTKPEKSQGSRTSHSRSSMQEAPKQDKESLKPTDNKEKNDDDDDIMSHPAFLTLCAPLHPKVVAPRLPCPIVPPPMHMEEEFTEYMLERIERQQKRILSTLGNM